MEAVIRRGASGMPAFPDLKDTEVKALLDLVDRWKTGSR